MSDKQPWPGIASFSKSVLCLTEPFNTKPLFGRIVSRIFDLLTQKLAVVQFVQVGANDGVRADHIHPFVASGRWRGALVEPAPKPFERLLKTYAGVDGLHFVDHAISTSSEPQPFYYVEGDDGLSSFSLDTILSHAPKYDDLKGMIHEIQVEAETLDDLCDRLCIAPDVVAVDTEGTDDLVLKSFAIERRRPSLILFEHCHLSAARSAGIKDRLNDAGYWLIHDRHDALAIAPGTFDDETIEFFADMISIARANTGNSAL